MARKHKTTNGSGKPTKDEVTAKHNVKSRNLILAEIGTEFRRIHSERAVLNEDAGEPRKRLSDLDVNPQAFLHALRLADLDDGAARDAWMDAFHEAWGALGVGGQLDWVSALEINPNQPDHDVTEPEAAEGATA